MAIYQVVAIALLAVVQSCAPVFSELQSARMVGKNRFEITNSYSSVSATADEETEMVQDHVGIQAALGISSRVDLRMRYERLSTGYSIIGFGPKVSIIKDRFAFYLPLGRALGEESKDSWQLHPTLLFTLPAIPQKLDITLSPKYLIPFCKECADLVAVNFGLSFSSDLNKWAIRPEYGLLFNPEREGNLSHFSVGFSLAFGK